MKNIWITGASSGIGRALALKFAEKGWQVAASARREDLLNEISNLNKNISSFPLDVTDKEK
jgi:NADP-dependent 3-hydroxy acid dehydrogenase YdfG